MKIEELSAQLDAKNKLLQETEAQKKELEKELRRAKRRSVKSWLNSFLRTYIRLGWSILFLVPTLLSIATRITTNLSLWLIGMVDRSGGLLLFAHFVAATCIWLSIVFLLRELFG